MTVRIEQRTYDPVPAGVYDATITAIEADEGMFGPQVKFTFTLHGEFEGRELWAWCSRKFGPKTKSYEWTKAALGLPSIDRSYNFDSDHLLMREVRLVVSLKENDKGAFNKIEQLLPAPMAAPQQPLSAIRTSEPPTGDVWTDEMPVRASR